MSYYFDYAAATPILPEALKAMYPYYSDAYYNPSALYLSAQAVKKDMQAARAMVARGLGAKPNEIVFTAGGTEANNLAISGVARQYADAHIITSAIEHESVLQVAAQYNHDTIPVTDKGIVDISVLKSLICDETVLVSAMLVNNEIGTIQDIRTIAGIIENVRIDRRERSIERPIYLHTDACQAVNYLDIHTSRLGVDLLTINSGKIYGPKQTGALFVKTGVLLQPLIFGGGQERNLRSGTENVANCIGFAHALSVVRDSANEEVRRLEPLQSKIIQELVDGTKVRLNGADKKRRLVNNIHITIDGTDNERLLMELDERGIMIATGSACSASNDKPSHVLSAIGLSDVQSRNSIRITLGRYTTLEACEILIQNIKELVAKR